MGFVYTNRSVWNEASKLEADPSPRRRCGDSDDEVVRDGTVEWGKCRAYGARSASASGTQPLRAGLTYVGPTALGRQVRERG